MRWSLAIAFILSPLLAQGNGLSCQQCISSNDTACTGSSQACPTTADNCISTLTQTIITGGSPTTLFARTCGTSSDCNKTASLSNPKISVKISSTCCSTKDCTPEQPKLPSSKTTKTNVTCLSCLDVSSSSCYSSETITCSGDETKCIRYAVTMTAGSATSKVAVRGCATPSFCALKSTSESAGTSSIVVELACTDGSIRLQQSVFLLALSGLLLLRLSF
ncbi:phospholipase A2 inhibitor NAI-like isoform X1 [Pleurodeles waltl]|uniref:phospholipase A2 inhibitor NAI-like isoform X1 n=1 Tax=Pleurodeles waltl TaxID=8319 RepID=UPI0037096125